MNRDTIEAMRSTMQLTDLSTSLDLRNAGKAMVVSWKGQECGTVTTEKSDRVYQVSVPFDGRPSRTCDTMGEAVLYLAPELLEVPCTFVVKHYPDAEQGKRWAINSDAGTVAYAFCAPLAHQICAAMNADREFQMWHTPG